MIFCCQDVSIIYDNLSGELRRLATTLNKTLNSRGKTFQNQDIPKKSLALFKRGAFDFASNCRVAIIYKKVMANRAYLFSADRIDLEKPEFTKLPYYDSRHIIPILWFLFFKSDSIKTKVINSGEESWREPFLCETKDVAIQNFAERLSETEKYLTNKLRHSFAIDYNEFIENVRSWTGNYLLLESSEIVQDERQGFIQFEKALLSLDDKNLEQFINSLQFCTGTLGRVMDDREVRNCLIGFGYE